MMILIPFIPVLLCLLFRTTESGTLPMEITVSGRSQECLYEDLDAGESVTFSVFILSGAQLKGQLILEGPVANVEASKSGVQLHESVKNYDASKGANHLTRIVKDVDFEHMFIEQEEQMGYDDDDDDDEVFNLEDDDEADDEVKERKLQQARQKRAILQRKKAIERTRNRKRVTHVAGQPQEVTLLAKKAGWYRACLHSPWYQIVAEMDLRREADLRGMDQTTGHVNTWATFHAMEEEEYLEADTEEMEEGTNIKDFEQTRKYVEKLRRLVNEIQSKQHAERHRLMLQETSNAHAHSRMVLSNLVETVLFMLVTGFQIYTIRKWFATSSSSLPSHANSNRRNGK